MSLGMYLSFVNSKNFCTSQTALKSGSKFPPDFTSTDRYLVHFFEFFGDMPWSFLREDRGILSRALQHRC